MFICDARAANPFAIARDDDEGSLKIAYRGKPLLDYRFARGQFKPYVKELRTLAGANVLLDAPADHLHHHGLMYAIRIDGTNFWEEAPDAGRQEHVSLRSETGPEFAKLVQTIHWRSAASNRPILIENRELLVAIDEKLDEVALRWTARFNVGDAPVVLHGSGYNGLGLRLPPSWDRVALHRNSEIVPYSPEQKWDVTSARWAKVSEHSATDRGTVVLFGLPANAGETRFFSMANPFTYLSVTQNLEKRPIHCAPGEKFELNYLVVVSGRELTQEQTEARYQRWLKENAK